MITTLATPKRLLWITDRYPPMRGGMAVSCARQVAGLRRRGWQLDLLVIGPLDAGGAEEPQIIRRDVANADILISSAEPEPGMAANQAWLTVQAEHAKNPYECIVGFGATFGGYYATTFAAWLGLTSTVLVRGNDLDRDWFVPNRGPFVREAFTRATAIGAVSLEKVRRIAGLYPEKRERIAWTPNSVDSARWQLLPADRKRRDEVRSLLGVNDAGERVIGLFGELKAKKRIPFWLEAVRDAGLLDRIRILVVGNLDAATSAILSDATIAPRSLRMPFCPPDQLAGLYAAADYIAIPSMFEGMPNVLLEAMACGCVPLVSDAGAMSDVITDGVTGFLFGGEDRRAAETATVRALAQTATEKDEMSSQVRELVRSRFSLDRELDALCTLIAIR